MIRLALLLAACAAAGAPSGAKGNSGPRSLAQPRLSRERVVLHTSLGDLVLAFYPDVAPAHVAQILKLVGLGVYDSTYFYRVMPGFVAQLADARDRLRPLTPRQAAAIHPLKAEFSSLRHIRGVLSMAREDNDPNSATTSFSILLGPAPHLDGKYTIFGQLEQGQDVLNALAAQPTDSQNRPLQRIGIDRAEVVDVSKVSGVLRPRPIFAIAPQVEPKSPAVPLAWLWLVGAMMLVGLGIALTAGRLSPGATASLGMLTVLIGYFLVFLAIVPRTRQNSLWGLGIFTLSMAIFKTMSYFERSS